MSDPTLRAWWSHRQGLDGSLRGAAPDAVLARAGWARSVGGVGPYLALHARAGTRRAEADAAVEAVAIHELPSARGCTYVVPAGDHALALAVGRAFGGAEMKTARKLGVTEAEIDALADAVLAALDAGPLDPDAIRAATGDRSRSLGEAGKKKGLTTTLPVALGRLQVDGRIRRIPANGRLDQQRYRYARWIPGPLDGGAVDPAAAYVELARRFFRWHGPATAGEFQWFSGLGVRAAQQALAPLGLVPAREGSDRLLLPEDVDAFRAFAMPPEPQYALVGSLDPIAANRRDVPLLLDGADARRQLLDVAAGLPLNALADLSCHAILDRGTLVGLWEYDVDAQEIVWATFDGRRDAALDAAIDATQSFVRDDLGDARAHALDSLKSRAPRLAALRTMR